MLFTDFVPSIVCGLPLYREHGLHDEASPSEYICKVEDLSETESQLSSLIRWREALDLDYHHRVVRSSPCQVEVGIAGAG